MCKRGVLSLEWKRRLMDNDDSGELAMKEITN